MKHDDDDDGRGLRSQERTAPAAWLGSWAQNLAAVTKRSGVGSLDDLDTCDLPLAAACRDALAALPPAPASGGDDTDDLPSWRELALEPRKKIQRMFSRRIDKRTYSDLLTSMDASNRARVGSCGGPLASA